MIPKYQQETIDEIRKQDSKELNKLNDEQIAYLYSYWSEESACAGWLSWSPTGIKNFIEWATTPPYKYRIEQFHKHIDAGIVDDTKAEKLFGVHLSEAWGALKHLFTKSNRL